MQSLWIVSEAMLIILYVIFLYCALLSVVWNHLFQKLQLFINFFFISGWVYVAVDLIFWNCALCLHECACAHPKTNTNTLAIESIPWAQACTRSRSYFAFSVQLWAIDCYCSCSRCAVDNAMILRFCTPNTCYWGTVKDRIIAQKKGKVNAISEWCWAQ